MTFEVKFMSTTSAGNSPINRNIERVSPELVEAAAKYQAAVAAPCMAA
jgi:4-hydroxy-4-methyl-2-oxoglutarate aldolase